MNKPAGKGLGKNAKARHRPRGTGASSVYESLKTKILNLELKPGTLLDETELSRQYHLSRSPVREALIRLSAEGLVETRALVQARDVLADVLERADTAGDRVTHAEALRLRGRARRRDRSNAGGAP